jgi:hypothetical protein
LRLALDGAADDDGEAEESIGAGLAGTEAEIGRVADEEEDEEPEGVGFTADDDDDEFFDSEEGSALGFATLGAKKLAVALEIC